MLTTQKVLPGNRTGLFGLCFCGVREKMSPLLETQLAVERNLASEAALLSCCHISLISCDTVWTLAQFSAFTVPLTSLGRGRNKPSTLEPISVSHQPQRAHFQRARQLRIAIKRKTWWKFSSGSFAVHQRRKIHFDPNICAVVPPLLVMGAAKSSQREPLTGAGCSPCLSTKVSCWRQRTDC